MRRPRRAVVRMCRPHDGGPAARCRMSAFVAFDDVWLAYNDELLAAG